jgi:phosphoglucomutase
VQALRDSLPRLKGKLAPGLDLTGADDFAYHDPVDGGDSEHQGIRLHFEDGSRIVYRLSGTGTSGATLRVYIERFEQDPARQNRETEEALADLAALSRDRARIRHYTGREAPTVIT